MIWTELPDKSGSTMTAHTGDWPAMVARLINAGAYPDKNSCPWFKAASFGKVRSKKGSLRTNENVLEVFGIEADYDGEKMPIDDAAYWLTTFGIKAALYPSPSSTADKPRWRVVAPLSKPHPPAARAALVARLNGALGGVLAKESFTLSQGYFFGATPTNDYRVVTTFDDVNGGECIDLLDGLDDGAISKQGTTKEAPSKAADTDVFDVLVDAGTINDLRCALAFMPSDERVQWVDVGLALKALGEQGRGLWLEWSEKSAKFDADDATNKWESFAPTKIGYQSVFHMAQTAGWNNPKSKAATQLETVIDAITGEITQRPRSFEFVSAGDMLREPKPLTYMIDELIEHESLVLLFAPPSAGKSFCALGWGCAVATGTPWLGRDTRQGSVFYLAGEGHAGISRRLKAWTLHSGHDLAAAPFFTSKVPAALMSADSVQGVLDAVEGLAAVHGKPALIVIDTFARNMGDGDESSNRDVGVFINHIDDMRYRLGCTVLLVHHSGHSATDRGRGASALPAAMDACFQLETKGDSICLSQNKSKEAENIEPLLLKLVRVSLPGWLDSKGRTLDSAVIVEREPLPADIARLPNLTEQQQNAVDAYVRAAQSLQSIEVTIDAWRIEFNKTATQENDASRNSAFRRARDELVKTNRMELKNRLYSLVGAAGNRLAAEFFDDLTVGDIGDTTRHYATCRVGCITE